MTCGAWTSSSGLYPKPQLPNPTHQVYRPGKTYKPPRERFPDGGKVSQYVDSLQIGETLDIQGPFGALEP